MGAQDDYNQAWEDGAKHERERCAILAEALATVYETNAAKIREQGTYEVRALWPFGKRIKCVLPKFEEGARAREAAASALRNAIAQGCRKGWDPRKLPGWSIDSSKQPKADSLYEAVHDPK